MKTYPREQTLHVKGVVEASTEGALQWQSARQTNRFIR